MSNTPSQTKVVATIGPSCNNKDVLRKMIKEGIDVCRLNFSHGQHSDHEAVIKIINELNEEMETNVAILVDLQGPKLRVGEIENNGVELKEGAFFELVSEKIIGTKERAYMSYTRLPLDVEPGETILVDDGKLKLEVVETNRKDTVKTKVISGGVLSSRKGVNLPNTKISLPSLTEKDIDDVNFALKFNIDWIALSFVRSVTDIVDLKSIIKKKKKSAKVIAKIEKPEAINDLDNIIEVTDGVMVARGDLGVETPFDQVPVIQKQIVKKCISLSKPVIIATQVMESMITNFRPTRAEANDAANAVVDGADALMLSGETSIGKYPVEVIQCMQQIITATEGSGVETRIDHKPDRQLPTYLPDSICYNAVKMANLSGATAIVVFTFNAGTAYRVASHRPNCPIFAFTPTEKLLSQMQLIWGVRPFYLQPEVSINDAISHSVEILKSKRLIDSGDVLVFVGSIPMRERGKTNMMKITMVD